MVDAHSDAAPTGGGSTSRAGAVAEPAPTSGRARRRTIRALLGLAVLSGLYVSFTFWQVWHASRVDARRPSDAIVVLGAAQYDGRPSPVLQARLDTAYDLYERGLAPLVVTTGANQVGDRHTEAESGYDYLRDKGVPESALLAIPIGSNTWEELSATADELQARGGSSVVLVSDSYHAYRVDHVADEVGLDGVVVSTPGSAPLSRLLRETAGASVGRFVGYEALSKLG
jgi:uncharacterized SAM-binding protein YcdF (DUF218 family)